MGKKNRIKNKQKKVYLSKITVVAKISSPGVPSPPKNSIPSHQDLQNSKEVFVDKLKVVYSRHLKKFQEISLTRVESGSLAQIKVSNNFESSLKDSEWYIHDPSNEYFHIFYTQLNRFLNKIVTIVRDIYVNFPKVFELTIADAYKIIETLCLDINQIALNLYKHSQVSFDTISFSLFKEKLKNDAVLNKILLENQDDNSSVDFNKPENELDNTKDKNLQTKNGKKKRKKEKALSENILDLEVQEFQSKLELESPAFEKIKPNFSEDWIAGLRKKLRERINSKSF
jgi:hypothetical protein